MTAKKRMHWRRVWLVTHKWLGLGMGVLFAVAAFTGAVLVYEVDLDRLVNTRVHAVTPGDVGLERVLSAIDAGGSVTPISVRWPQRREPLYYIEATRQGERFSFRVDPGTGSVLRSESPFPVLRLMRRLHTNLFLGRPGRYLMLATCALALVSFVSGAVLWWPGLRRVGRRLRVRLRHGFRAANYDLHRTVGVLALPLLVIMTATALMLGFPDATERLMRSVSGANDGVKEWAPVAADGWTGSGGATPVELLRAAQAAVPGLQPLLLRLSAQPERPAIVHFGRGSTGASGTVVDVLVHPGTARVLQVRDPALLQRSTRLAHDLVHNLHVGAVGGPLVRLWYALSAAAGGLLAVSGALIWWLKRRRAERRPITAAAPRVASGA